METKEFGFVINQKQIKGKKQIVGINIDFQWGEILMLGDPGYILGQVFNTLTNKFSWKMRSKKESFILKV